jgi:hypothetical protein
MLIDTRLAEIFHELEEELHQPNRKNPLIVKSLLMALFSLLARAELLPLKAIVYPPQIDGFPHLYRRHYKSCIGLITDRSLCDGWLKHVLSVPTISGRLFRTHLNTTPLGYLTRLRAEIARNFWRSQI